MDNDIFNSSLNIDYEMRHPCTHLEILFPFIL
jgi:hypothetical protein